MLKPLLTSIFSLLLFMTVNAQNGGLIYYLKNDGKLVSTKDSADYSLAVLPPDTSIDKTLYVVYEYYKNGKVKLITNSKTNDINLQYQGNFVSYYPEGKKKQMGRFENGNIIGRVVEYYLNGKLYYSLNYRADGNILYSTCRDSTGKVLADNGTGSWIEFDDNFSGITAEGKIDSGMRVGVWREKRDDSVFLMKTYKNGILTTTEVVDKNGNKVFLPVDVVPEFPGGMEAFGRFLAKSIRYPARAFENRTQGKVIVSFVIERDGSFTDMRVARGIGDGCDEEALRVMKLMPKWKPGIQNGKPVRVAYSVPVAFSLYN